MLFEDIWLEKPSRMQLLLLNIESRLGREKESPERPQGARTSSLVLYIWDRRRTCGGDHSILDFEVNESKRGHLEGVVLFLKYRVRDGQKREKPEGTRTWWLSWDIWDRRETWNTCIRLLWSWSQKEDMTRTAPLFESSHQGKNQKIVSWSLEVLEAQLEGREKPERSQREPKHVKYIQAFETDAEHAPKQR